MLEAPPAVMDGLIVVEACGGRHGAGRVSPPACGVAGGGLKMARNLTTACTRPPTRQFSNSNNGSGRRVMPGVRRRHDQEVCGSEEGGSRKT